MDASRDGRGLIQAKVAGTFHVPTAWNGGSWILAPIVVFRFAEERPVSRTGGEILLQGRGARSQLA